LGEGLGMVNIGPLQELSQRDSWRIIEHTLIGDDLRIRALRR
jgi:diaminohydroxyphosphoribosylaminopyrimidine deaminase/5-amino-6-(5-phosphoribosylamino)uracil reductase